MRLIDADSLTAPLLPFKGMSMSVAMLLAAVNNAKTVDAVQVRHGSWIDMDVETYTWKIRCSRCGHERGMMSTGKTYPMWCENCGARMDGDGNETD